jgi:hypothetical protein
MLCLALSQQGEKPGQNRVNPMKLLYFVKPGTRAGILPQRAKGLFSQARQIQLFG